MVRAFPSKCWCSCFAESKLRGGGPENALLRIAAARLCCSWLKPAFADCVFAVERRRKKKGNNNRKKKTNKIKKTKKKNKKKKKTKKKKNNMKNHTKKKRTNNSQHRQQQRRDNNVFEMKCRHVQTTPPLRRT